MAEFAAIQNLTLIGLDFRHCPDSLRARLFVDDVEIPDILSSLRAAQLTDAIVISTCDRLEVTLTSADPAAAMAVIAGILAAPLGMDSRLVTPYMSCLTGFDAVHHLFRVTASLDSQVVGESQVLGQVKAGHAAARKHGMANGLVDRCFQEAFRVAKTVRSETEIGNSPVSIAATAIDRCRALHGDLSDRGGVLIGTAEFGALMAEQLQRAGLSRLRVIDTNLNRAAALARRLSCHHGVMTDLGTALVDGDILLAAFGSGHHLLDNEMLASILRRRRQRPMLILDLAIPSDLDPSVNRLDDVFVFTLDDLEDAARDGRANRLSAAMAAEGLVVAAADDFRGTLEGRRADPEIAALQSRFQALRDEVLRAEPTADADKATQLLINRLLHAPLSRLRDMARDDALSAERRQMLRMLFDLDDDKEG
jgi:glutamyl-tRNA reductase